MDTPALFKRFMSLLRVFLQKRACQVLPSVPLSGPSVLEARLSHPSQRQQQTLPSIHLLEVPPIACSLTCYSACHQAQTACCSSGG